MLDAQRTTTCPLTGAGEAVTTCSTTTVSLTTWGAAAPVQPESSTPPPLTAAIVVSDLRNDRLDTDALIFASLGYRGVTGGCYLSGAQVLAG